MTVVTENVAVIPAGRNWTVKHMIVDGLPTLWCNNDRGLTVMEHKYTHLPNADGVQGHYHVWLKEYGGKTWLVYEMDIPESVQKVVRDRLKSYGFKWNRVVVLNRFADHVSWAYDMLAQRVMQESFDKPKSSATTNISLKSRHNSIVTNSFYPLYKAEFDELAAEQYEDYYTHVCNQYNI